MVQEQTQELLALQEARARERRLAAIGQLAAGVMHDVNNALNPIMAAAYLLEANAENPGAVRDYAVRIAKDRKSTRLNSSHSQISYAVFCLKKKKQTHTVAPSA